MVKELNNYVAVSSVLTTTVSVIYAVVFQNLLLPLPIYKLQYGYVTSELSVMIYPNEKPRVTKEVRLLFKQPSISNYRT